MLLVTQRWRGRASRSSKDGALDAKVTQLNLYRAYTATSLAWLVARVATRQVARVNVASWLPLALAEEGRDHWLSNQFQSHPPGLTQND
jgi:hypothetical protein